MSINRELQLYKEIKDKITTENIDSLVFSRSLRDSSLIYRDIVAAKDDDQELSSLLADVREVNANLLYPVILSAYEMGRTNEVKRLVQALLTTFIRHNIIGGLENSRLETLAFNIAKELRTDRDFSAAIEKLKQFSPTDEQFSVAFDTATVPRRQSARYILKELELAFRKTEELEVAPPSRVHIEHIYPQTPRQGEKWDNHTSVVNRLGNLTLLSRRLNVTVQNGDFLTKKPFYEQSELLATRALLTFDEWNLNKLNERQQGLSQKALEIWKYPENP
jgi:hypothetical protein